MSEPMTILEVPTRFVDATRPELGHKEDWTFDVVERYARNSNASMALWAYVCALIVNLPPAPTPVTEDTPLGSEVYHKYETNRFRLIGWDEDRMVIKCLDDISTTYSSVIPDGWTFRGANNEAV